MRNLKIRKCRSESKYVEVVRTSGKIINERMVNLIYIPEVDGGRGREVER